MKKDDVETKTVTVVYSGYIKHAAGERQSRYIKGDQRDELRKQFNKGPDKPSVVYQERKSHLSSDAMASGNRTGCGNQPETMRKISSEGKQISQMDKDLGKSLEIIQRELIEKESSRQVPPSAAHDGFVHTIGIHPLLVHMWTETQVKLWHDRCKNDISYPDATGTLIANHGGKRVLYYALVIRHPVEGEPSLPVAEMVTSDQSAGNIRAFIERFQRDESRLYSGHMSMPRQINTDYSRAILLAMLKEFNNETMVDFLARAVRIVTRSGSKTDLMLTIPHVGCSHFMHIVHKKIKQLSRVETTARKKNFFKHGEFESEKLPLL